MPLKLHRSLTRRACLRSRNAATEGLIAGRLWTAFTTVDLGIRVAELNGHVALKLFAVNACFDARNFMNERALSVSSLRELELIQTKKGYSVHTWPIVPMLIVGCNS